MFLSLLPEIQDLVLSNSCITDLKNLSLASSECYNTLREYLSHTVRITEDILERNDFRTDRKMRKMLRRLADTKSLRISAYRNGMPKLFYMMVSKLDKLEELDLCRSTGVEDSDIRALCTGLQNVKKLNLSYSKVTCFAFCLAGSLTKLEELNINHCWKINDDGISKISSITSLLSLDISYCWNISDHGISHIVKLQYLQQLNLRNCWNLTDSAMMHISKLKNLQSLNLCNCWNITDFAFQHLSRITTLKILQISGCCNITDEAFSYIRKFRLLEVLSLTSCSVTDVAFSNISQITNLKKLDASFCDFITDNGIRAIRTLKMLRELKLSGCSQLTNECIFHIRQLESLQKLNIQYCAKIWKVTGLSDIICLWEHYDYASMDYIPIPFATHYV